MFLLFFVNCNSSSSNDIEKRNVNMEFPVNAGTSFPINNSINVNSVQNTPMTEERRMDHNKRGKLENLNKSIEESVRSLQEMPNANKEFNKYPDLPAGNKCFSMPTKTQKVFGGQSPISKVEKVVDCGVVISAKVYLRTGKIYELSKSKIRKLEKATEQEILKMLGVNSVVKTNSNTK